MKVSLSWLKDYVDIRNTVPELVHLLTMAGLEVEHATPVGQGLEKVIVVEVGSVRRHPNADRLVLVKAKTENETYSIVCGATNLKEGLKVPLALPGARLPNGLEIRKSKIRGEPSEGMLCSPIEINLGQDASGILILPAELPLGVNLGEALKLSDTVLDISITPNRADCLSAIGIAREIAALTGQKLRYPQTSLSGEGDEIHRKTSVTIVDPDLCPRYVARIIEGVTIGPSPQWIKDRLEKVGVRSISNVVDVTNFVMMECGQPLHAFDFELLDEHRIVVRRAREGEEFVTLDQVKRALDPDVLMICDAAKPVAIAGIMGGMNSEISDRTKTVLLESAYFDPMGNRKASLKLGLETEASYRFGRGVDYEGTVSAANRAAQLIQELAGGRIVPGIADAYPSPIPSRSISLRVKRTNDILGTEIPPERVKGSLEALELKVESNGPDRLTVVPPSFRRDLEREIDLIEEVARLDGYDRIPITLPEGPAVPIAEEAVRKARLDEDAIQVLLHHGFHEVITYSFTSPGSSDPLAFGAEDPRSRPVRILNPLSEEFSVLRTSLFPGLLETARYNLSWKNEDIRIFEIRKVFLPRVGEKLPEERKILAGLALGKHAELHWGSPPRPIDFYDIKGVMEDLLDSFQIEGARFNRVEDVPYLHPGKAARIMAGDEVLGLVGELHPNVSARTEMGEGVFLFELDFERLLRHAGERRRFKPLAKFPAVYRDISLIMNESDPAGDVVQAILELKQPLIDEVLCFDLYRGAPIPNEKKGVSFRIRYQSRDRTLTDDEVNRIHERVVSRLREVFRAELRV
jgi:phenylalanyl-tRNA synthetase beta chain